MNLICHVEGFKDTHVCALRPQQEAVEGVAGSERNQHFLVFDVSADKVSVLSGSVGYFSSCLALFQIICTMEFK